MDNYSERLNIIEQYRQRVALGKHVRLYKAEFDLLVKGFVERLQPLKKPEEIKQLCKDEIALLEEGYPQLTLASDYIPRYRRAISEAIATRKLAPSQHQYLHHQRITSFPQERDEHWALTFFKYSQEEYEHLDRRQAKTNRKRLLNLKKVNPWRYLDVLNELLLATGTFAARHRTIAIVGLTGRRFGEVVARGTFSLTSHPYLLHFEGQQKSERDGYDIITLIPAEIVLMHLERLREMPELHPFAKKQGADLKQAINKFDVQVNRECDKLLMKPGVMPPLDGKDHVTIHNLRSLWGAIATLLFCPPEQHEYAFLQHYLGHILESSATGHYFRYLLVDSEGQLLQQKGIKQQEIPPLPLLETDEESHETDEEFVLDSPMEEISEDQELEQQQYSSTQETNTAPERRKGQKMNIQELQASLRQEWQEEIKQVEQNLHSTWSAQVTALQKELKQQITKLRQQLHPEAVQQLSQQVESLEAERETLTTQLQQAQQEKQEMAAQLEEAQAKLDSFRKLLLGTEDSKQPSVQEEQHSTKQTTLKATSPKTRKRGKAAQRAQHIFDALRAWNDQHPHGTLAFSPGMLETMFRVHRKAGKAFCEEFHNEIEDHHAEIGVERVLTHNKGKDIDGFKRFVEQFK